MRVGIVDVGSNTVRLLVASRRGSSISALRTERAQVGLAADIERFGRISAAKLDETAWLAHEFAAIAHELGVFRLEIVVTAPGRQSSNADLLVRSLCAATGTAVRVLSAEEEGRLAYAGATAGLDGDHPSVTVVDVGGGSTQLIFGTSAGGPVWLRSLDLGSLRLAQRFLRSRPVAPHELLDLRREVARAFEGLAPPLPKAGLATGGTARALRRLAGRTLTTRRLDKAVSRLAETPSAQLAAEYGLDEARARTLPAGALVLAEAQRRLGVPLDVARGGIREGAALELLESAEAA